MLIWWQQERLQRCKALTVSVVLGAVCACILCSQPSGLLRDSATPYGAPSQNFDLGCLSYDLLFIWMAAIFMLGRCAGSTGQVRKGDCCQQQVLAVKTGYTNGCFDLRLCSGSSCGRSSQSHDPKMMQRSIHKLS